MDRRRQHPPRQLVIIRIGRREPQALRRPRLRPRRLQRLVHRQPGVDLQRAVVGAAAQGRLHVAVRALLDGPVVHLLDVQVDLGHGAREDAADRGLRRRLRQRERRQDPRAAAFRAPEVRVGALLRGRGGAFGGCGAGRRRSRGGGVAAEELGEGWAGGGGGDAGGEVEGGAEDGTAVEGAAMGRARVSWGAFFFSWGTAKRGLRSGLVARDVVAGSTTGEQGVWDGEGAGNKEEED